MKSLIIGAGQVGKALFDVVCPYHETFLKDIDDLACEGVKVLHICYPDHDDFVETTETYIKQYQPLVTIIHSSVKVGTTEKIRASVVYSPVRGRHPKLAEDMKIYKKFIFGTGRELQIATDYFERCRLDVVPVEETNFRQGEFLKLISNIHMGLEIVWRQEVERLLNHLEIDPSVYEFWERSYQDGYIMSGDKRLIRPIMKPDAIGGHCILPCVSLLKKSFKSKFLDLIEETNDRKRSESLKEVESVAR